MLSRNEKNNSHYRDCEAITANLSRIKKEMNVMPIFGYVKLLTIAAILSIGMASESQAEDVCINSSDINVTCIEKLTDKNGNNSCGTNCTFRVVNENGKQVLHVYKVDISQPATIRAGAFSPNYYADKKVKDAQGNALPLQNIVLDNDFENIRGYAFAESHAKISSASGKFVLNENTSSYIALRTTLNGDIYLNNPVHSSLEASTINGDVIVADGVKGINAYMLSDTKINGNLILPSSINKFRIPSGSLTISGQIYCATGVEACYNMAKAGCGDDTSCVNKINNLFNSGKFTSYPDGCAKLEANLVCTKCKSASFRLEDGYCLRKIYTPAEAAEVLNDDDNAITITFKK